jgi:exosortase F-associated protein
MPRLSLKQGLLLALALFGWAAVYLFQEFDYTRMAFQPGQYEHGYIPEGEGWRFAINKGIRFLLNDLFSLLLIYALFDSKSFSRLALLVMAFGLVVLLPLYLVLALGSGQEHYHLFIFMHRITMNPWLMLLLVPAFFYQTNKKQ